MAARRGAWGLAGGTVTLLAALALTACAQGSAQGTAERPSPPASPVSAACFDRLAEPVRGVATAWGMAEDDLDRADGQSPFLAVWLDNVTQFQAFADEAGCGGIAAVRDLTAAAGQLQSSLSSGAGTGAAVSAVERAVARLQEAVPPAP